MALFVTIAVTASIIYLKYFVKSEAVDCITDRDASNGSFACLNEVEDTDLSSLQADAHRSMLFTIGAVSAAFSAISMLPIS